MCGVKPGPVVCPVVGCRRRWPLGGRGWAWVHMPGQEGASREMGGKPVSRGRTLGGLGPQWSCEPSCPPGEAQGPLASAGASGSPKSLESRHLPTDFRETGWGWEWRWMPPAGPFGHGGAEHIPQCSPATSVHMRRSWIHGAPSSASTGTLSITASLTTWPWRAGVFTPASGLWRCRKGFCGG